MGESCMVFNITSWRSLTADKSFEVMRGTARSFVTIPGENVVCNDREGQLIPHLDT